MLFSWLKTENTGEQRGSIMTQAEGVVDVDVWKEKVQQDINELKINQNQQEKDLATIKKDIIDLQVNDKLQDREIASVKETLSEIKEDTNWIRRKITGAIITAAITAAVAGIVGVAITKIYGG